MRHCQFSTLKATESLHLYDRFAVPAGPVFLQARAPVQHLRILCAGHWLSDTENTMRTARHGRGRGDDSTAAGRNLGDSVLACYVSAV